MQAKLRDPLKVWGASAVEMTISAEDGLDHGFPYNVRVGLKNVSDIPVYNATAELLEKGRLGYIYQPRERLVQSTAVLAPGETFWADYLLVPWIPGGELDLARSFVKRTGGNAEPLATRSTQRRRCRR